MTWAVFAQWVNRFLILCWVLFVGGVIYVAIDNTRKPTPDEEDDDGEI